MTDDLAKLRKERDAYETAVIEVLAAAIACKNNGYLPKYTVRLDKAVRAYEACTAVTP